MNNESKITLHEAVDIAVGFINAMYEQRRRRATADQTFAYIMKTWNAEEATVLAALKSISMEPSNKKGA